MASNFVIYSTLIFRILALLSLVASIIVMALNNFTVNDEFKTSFTDVIAYTYARKSVHIAASGSLYLLLQIPSAIYHACAEKRVRCLAEFDFYGDKVISLLLGTGVGAGFAVSFEFKRHLSDVIELVELVTGDDLSELKSKNEKYLNRAIIATALLFLGLIFMAILSVLSSVSRGAAAKNSKGFFFK